MERELTAEEKRLAIERLIEFDIEDWIAILNKEEISYEVYEKCLDICVKIGDTKTFDKLIKNYPHHAERQEEEFAKIKEIKLPELSEAESQRLHDEIMQKIREIESQKKH